MVTILIRVHETSSSVCNQFSSLPWVTDLERLDMFQGTSLARNDMI